MKGLITQAEYARSRKIRGLPGGTAPAVWRAIHTKRIKLIDGLIDPAQADQDWERNSNHRQQRGIHKIAGPVEANAEPQAEKTDGDFLEAQRQREWERVKRERLARRKQEGELIDRATVEADWTDIAIRLQNAVMGLPARIANRMSAESRHEILTVATDECRKILVSLSNEIRSTPQAA